MPERGYSGSNAAKIRATGSVVKEGTTETEGTGPSTREKSTRLGRHQGEDPVKNCEAKTQGDATPRHDAKGRPEDKTWVTEAAGMPFVNAVKSGSGPAPGLHLLPAGGTHKAAAGVPVRARGKKLSRSVGEARDAPSMRRISGSALSNGAHNFSLISPQTFFFVTKLHKQTPAPGTRP